jgi:hypothetical protein
MNIEHWLVIAIFLLGAGSLIGFFRTKTEGFGRFTTSTFLILLVITISALLYSAGKLEGQVMANVLFAVFGFAGGLFTSKNGN